MELNKNSQRVSFKQFFFLTLLLLVFTCILVSFYAQARPKTQTIHGHNLEGFARAKIKNDTVKDLACWIAIDGQKYKFRLPALTESPWFTANSKNYNYTHFRSWCDYIEFHPEYQKYNRG